MERQTCCMCGQPVADSSRPGAAFCSERCRMLDLSKWLEGEYRIPVPITERDLPDLETQKGEESE